MSRSGNCQDNIVIEGFFLLLKQERIKPKTNASRAKKGSYFLRPKEIPVVNPARRHSYNDDLSRVRFERQRQARLVSV
jgi:putative transposase